MKFDHCLFVLGWEKQRETLPSAPGFRLVALRRFMIGLYYSICASRCVWKNNFLAKCFVLRKKKSGNTWTLSWETVPFISICFNRPIHLRAPDGHKWCLVTEKWVHPIAAVRSTSWNNFNCIFMVLWHTEERVKSFLGKDTVHHIAVDFTGRCRLMGRVLRKNWK